VGEGSDLAGLVHSGCSAGDKTEVLKTVPLASGLAIYEGG
jgi:hypothetical protein